MANVTRKWFDDNLWNLMSEGYDPDITYKTFLDVLKTEKIGDTNKSLITKEYILQKFSEYISYKDSLGQYASALEKKKVPLNTWLVERQWKFTYKPKIKHNPSRDNYFYGI